MDDIDDTTRMIVMIILLERWVNNDKDGVKMTMGDDNENEEE